ncbi:P-loop containing nucleoside triphosphate hydrolase protein [Meredithblackwellia eburnea MCA 4105]
MSPFRGSKGASRAGGSTTTTVTSIPRSRFSLERDDPLALAIAPDQDESTDARSARIAREDEQKRVSDEIDKMLEQEAKEKRKSARLVNELQILLLGPTGAGKTTFLKQCRLMYDLKGLDAEREANRLVILLNIVHTARTLLSILEGDTAASGQSSGLDSSSSFSPAPTLSERPLSPSGREIPAFGAPRNEQEANYRRRIRLAPLLGLESQLRESLGVIATGPSAGSLSAHAQDRTLAGEGVQKLDWRDAAPVNGVNDNHYRSNSIDPASPTSNGIPNGLVAGVNGSAQGEDVVMQNGTSAESGSSSPTTARRNQVRSRAASPAGVVDNEPLFHPGFAEKLGSIAFGQGKEGRRARAQGTKPTSGTSTDGQFLAGPDDPIHLLAALREEVEDLWKEAVDRGLIAGEGPKSNSPGGLELSESARYFLSSLGRIASANWKPTDDDMLNVRVRTLGIEQHTLQITPTQIYRICDVAGARGVKHSWAPYFEGAAALIFIFATSDYNVCDPRNKLANRLSDALDLFHDIATNKILENVTMIVFMNKIDLLRKKLKSGLYPLEDYLKGFPGGTKSKDVLLFIQSKVEERHATRKRHSPLYCYATQANDQKSIKFIVSAVNDVLMRGTLTASGLL